VGASHPSGASKIEADAEGSAPTGRELFAVDVLPNRQLDETIDMSARYHGHAQPRAEEHGMSAGIAQWVGVAAVVAGALQDTRASRFRILFMVSSSKMGGSVEGGVDKGMRRIAAASAGDGTE